MNWINIPISFPFGDECRGSKPVDRSTWFMLNAYCHMHENGGVIRSARSWPDRKWQQVVAVTRKEVMTECALWEWEGEDLHVRHYPTDKEAEVKAKRESGRAGGSAKSDAKSNAVRRNGAKGGRPPREDCDENLSKNQSRNQTERKGREGKRKGKEGNMDARASDPIDGGALEKAIRGYCDASGKKYSSEALKSAVRQIQAGAISQAELIAKLEDIAKTARRNRAKDKHFLMSLDSLIELEGWKSPLDTWLVGDNPEHSTIPNSRPYTVQTYE
jgi:hypothetical protein